MRVLLWIQRAIQFVFDPEIYCLAGLAIRNHLRSRSHRPATTKEETEEKKRAQAVNS